jgi:hypothetical protein
LRSGKTAKTGVRAGVIALSLCFAVAVADGQTAIAEAPPSPTGQDVEVITVTQLSENGQFYDDKQVCIMGEVVGDTIRDSPGLCWLLLTDGESSVSLLVSSNDATLIENHGRYKITGTQIEVQGTFHLACNEHAGLTDIHAESIRVLDDGGPVQIAVDYGLLGLGGALIVGGALLLLLYRFLHNRSR